MFYKKGDIGFGAVIVIIIIVIFLGWLINQGWKECRVDSDCGSDQYCTSQFTCKNIPVIEKSSPSQAGDYTNIAWIIGLSLIIAALIMKWDSFFPKKRNNDKPKNKEGYVDLSKSHNAEESGLHDEFLDENY